jgi:ATP-dependent RNA helicase DeaD
MNEEETTMMNEAAVAESTLIPVETLTGSPPPKSITFADLTQDPTILKALTRVGFTTPTPVQAESLRYSLGGEDLMLQAKTGSGKTLAFALPILGMLGQEQENSELRQVTRAIILAPTRELASQICEVFRSLSDEVAPCLVIGGLSIASQIKDLSRDPRVVVGTPGRILDLMRQRELNLKECAFFAVDEVDEMFSMDFAEDVRAILSRVPPKRQGIFVSATISPKVEMLANNFLTNPRKIVISSPGEELPPVEHLYLEVSGEVTAKATALCDLIESYNPRSAIIFCNTKSDTELMEAYLRRRGYDARLLNSDLNQRQRDAIMAQMRSGELRILVGTDLAARGLDIAELTLVVNYSLPDQPEVYVHRTGRTGRAGKSGRAVSLIGPQDFMAWMTIKRFVSMPIQQLTPPSESDLVTARVAHLHALLREAELSPQAKDIAMAQRFLNDLGVEAASEECAATIAKLSLAFIEQVAAAKKQKLTAQAEKALAARANESRDSDERGNGQLGARSTQDRFHSDHSQGRGDRRVSRHGRGRPQDRNRGRNRR